jgi:drug/metabolite transporter (DMT)-like permease
MLRPGPFAVLATVAALIAFAANSVLARAALGPAVDGPLIGAMAFTVVRLGAGALVLTPWWWRRPIATGARRGWLGPVTLVAYALPFSVAYVALGAGTGALLLFGAVQATMLLAGRRAGERFGARETIGLLAAAIGLAVLVAPGLRAPAPWPAALMLLAGLSWGLYSLAGRTARDPVAATARNFAGALPFVLLLALVPGTWTGATAPGLLLAVVSGALTSGLGYLVWYRALPSLSRTAASVVQLLVPVVAALGGVAFLHETVDARLLVASILVLGGVGLVVVRRT